MDSARNTTLKYLQQRHFYFLDNEDWLIFCAPVFLMSSLCCWHYFFYLPEMILIFYWSLVLKVCQGNSICWWCGNCLDLSCLWLFVHCDSFSSSTGVLLAVGLTCLLMSLVIPSDLVLYFCWFSAISVSFVVMGWLMHVSDLGRCCSWVRCSLTTDHVDERTGWLFLLAAWYCCPFGTTLPGRKQLSFVWETLPLILGLSILYWCHSL